MKPHKKHSFLEKPLGGQFHRHEIGFIGAPCGVIQGLTEQLAVALPQLRVGYADAEHGQGEVLPGFARRYTDKISHHQLEFNSEHFAYEAKSGFGACDLVLVNANHFPAQKQVVFIHPAKRESLQRKLERLTDVGAFVLAEEEDALFDFLIEYQPAWADLPQFKVHQVAELAQWITRQVEPPEVFGLVLAGGKSQRMGQDKTQLVYHEKPQREHTAELLNQVCSKVFVSDRAGNAEGSYPTIADTFLDLGPYGGILSAFRQHPNVAWLTVASDMPLVQAATLQQLVQQRNASQLATCFHNPETQFPEPLLTLWEPRAYPRLLHFMSLGYSCPRKVLINSDVEELKLERPELLKNANTPEERVALQRMIEQA